LEVRGDEQSVMNSGKLFHARGPVSAKARSPSDERATCCWQCTTRAYDEADPTARRYFSNVIILHC